MEEKEDVEEKRVAENVENEEKIYLEKLEKMKAKEMKGDEEGVEKKEKSSKEKKNLEFVGSGISKLEKGAGNEEKGDWELHLLLEGKEYSKAVLVTKQSIQLKDVGVPSKFVKLRKTFSQRFEFLSHTTSRKTRYLNGSERELSFQQTNQK